MMCGGGGGGRINEHAVSVAYIAYIANRFGCSTVRTKASLTKRSVATKLSNNFTLQTLPEKKSEGHDTAN